MFIYLYNETFCCTAETGMTLQINYALIFLSLQAINAGEGKGNPPILLVGMQIVITTRENSMKIL